MTRKTTAYARKRAHRARIGASDGITIARMTNTRLTGAELQRVLEPCRRAVAAFRTGSATYQQWVVLCTAGHVAQAIEDGGIIRGQQEIISEADAVLDAIGARAGTTEATWRPTTLHGREITALADLVHAHNRQVRELTYGEYTRSADKAVARVATNGGAVFRMETGAA